MCTYSVFVYGCLHVAQAYAFRMIRLLLFFLGGQVCTFTTVLDKVPSSVSMGCMCVHVCVCVLFGGSLTYYSTNKLTILIINQLTMNACSTNFHCLIVCCLRVCVRMCGIQNLFLFLIKCTTYDQFYVAALRSQRCVMLFGLNKKNLFRFSLSTRQKFVQNAIFWVISSRIFAFFICTIYIFIYIYNAIQVYDCWNDCVGFGSGSYAY